MKNLRKENGVSIILILIIIVVVLGVIMGIKVFMSKNKQDNYVEYSNSLSEKTKEYLDKSSSVKDYDYTTSGNKTKSNNYLKSNIISNIILIRGNRTFNIVRNIINFIIAVIINIGIAKLYKKLNMPDWTVKFMIAYPFVMEVCNLLPNIIKMIISFGMAIVGIVSLGKYFKAIGMKESFAALPLIGVAIILLGVSLGVVIGSFMFILTCIIGGIILIASAIIYIISNIELAKMFNKERGFTIGLAILPIIFQPILGYQKEDNLL